MKVTQGVSRGGGEGGERDTQVTQGLSLGGGGEGERDTQVTQGLSLREGQRGYGRICKEGGARGRGHGL